MTARANRRSLFCVSHERTTMIESNFTGQMAWRIPGMTDSALHLRHDESEPWRPYEEFPQYILPDPPHFSRGYATFLDLLKKGWTVIPC